MTMHVAASDHDRGICWMIAKIAEVKGISVTINEFSDRQVMLQEMADESFSTDYLVCSSELLPPMFTT